MTLYQYIEDVFALRKTPYFFGDIDAVLDRSESKSFVDSIAMQIETSVSNLDRQAAIAIYLPRNNAFMAAIFASWKSGNFYIPLNQDWPDAYTKKILEHLKPDLIISDNMLFSEYATVIQPVIPFDKFDAPLSVVKRWKQKSLEPGLAYIIYTSGSTGEQKGVMIEKHALCSYIAWTKSCFPDLAHCSKLLINGEMTFDISLADIAFALAHNIEIHLSPEANNLFAHLKLIIDRKIDSLYAVPSTLNNLYQWVELRDDVDFSSLKYIFSGGDVLSIDLIKTLKHHSPRAMIYNMYGPTEVTMNCLSIRVDNRIDEIADTNLVPTGMPPSHLSLKLLPAGDGKQAGETGELVVSGDQVMKGYLNDDLRTESAFISINGKRYYKTGDFFHCINGVFYFIDRIDSLVKIKGYRINLADITNLIDGESFIKEARVLAVDTNSKGPKVLVAVIVHTDDISDDDAAEKLDQLCKSALPGYMVPSNFLSIQKFPCGKTGKHDVRALAELIKNTLPQGVPK